MSKDAGERDVFKDHVATYEAYGDHLETLQWKKPGDSTYAIWFVRQHGCLMVFGDCYEATYLWNWQPGFGMRWIGGCNLGYFVSKCRASQHGMEPEVWDGHVLEANLKEYFADGCTYKQPMCSEGECECCDQRRKEAALFEEHGGWRHTDDEYDWVWWLRENGDAVFGFDWWEGVPNGRRLDPSVKLHLEGLKAALAQLEAKHEGPYRPDQV